MTPRRFALDQGFPQPIVNALRPYLQIDADLVPLGEIDQRLTELDDWEVLLALHHDAVPWDGLITTDAGMLALPRELSVLMQTRLTLVVALAAGHDPVKATGLLLTQLSGICERTVRDRPQVWKLGTTEKRPEDPWDELGRIAGRRGASVQTLYGQSRLGASEFARDPLAH